MKKDTTSAEKIIDLLEAFLSSNFAPMSVAEVMKKSGLKRNSADRLLQILKQRGYVTNDASNKWILTPKINRYSQNYADFCLNVIAKK